MGGELDLLLGEGRVPGIVMVMGAAGLEKARFLRGEGIRAPEELGTTMGGTFLGGDEGEEVVDAKRTVGVGLMGSPVLPLTLFLFMNPNGLWIDAIILCLRVFFSNNKFPS